ncbi:hypothetical protein LOTGIDRAFT_170625 [Lottia gigantea]|uniref:Uncharacterized protein n=1 Tax=Lottia gigantea TaxID=225164 RepID=V4AKD0_LOTGI|nr:hypothetical protein LOTGIDRAFT_170625 [Lottia gigantea]ESP04654.1 hypothetical protein LOTGIDRAFT_170625 [Lottia gigantea]
MKCLCCLNELEEAFRFCPRCGTQCVELSPPSANVERAKIDSATVSDDKDGDEQQMPEKDRNQTDNPSVVVTIVSNEVANPKESNSVGFSVDIVSTETVIQEDDRCNENNPSKPTKTLMDHPLKEQPMETDDSDIENGNQDTNSKLENNDSLPVKDNSLLEENKSKFDDISENVENSQSGDQEKEKNDLDKDLSDNMTNKKDDKRPCGKNEDQVQDTSSSNDTEDLTRKRNEKDDKPTEKDDKPTEKEKDDKPTEKDDKPTEKGDKPTEKDDKPSEKGDKPTEKDDKPTEKGGGKKEKEEKKKKGKNNQGTSQPLQLGSKESVI